jgi:hypothetical protein
METETEQRPILPAELWLGILQNLQREEDLPELWTSYRRVCKASKRAVEAIMRQNHLRKTWINFQLGKHILSCQSARINWVQLPVLAAKFHG